MVTRGNIGYHRVTKGNKGQQQVNFQEVYTIIKATAMETLLKSECALPQTQEVVSPKPVHCVSGEKIDFL